MIFNKKHLIFALLVIILLPYNSSATLLSYPRKKNSLEISYGIGLAYAHVLNPLQVDDAFLTAYLNLGVIRNFTDRFYFKFNIYGGALSANFKVPGNSASSIGGPSVLATAIVGYDVVSTAKYDFSLFFGFSGRYSDFSNGSANVVGSASNIYTGASGMFGFTNRVYIDKKNTFEFDVFMKVGAYDVITNYINSSPSGGSISANVSLALIPGIKMEYSYILNKNASIKLFLLYENLSFLLIKNVDNLNYNNVITGINFSFGV